MKRYISMLMLFAIIGAVLISGCTTQTEEQEKNNMVNNSPGDIPLDNDEQEDEINDPEDASKIFIRFGQAKSQKTISETKWEVVSASMQDAKYSFTLRNNAEMEKGGSGLTANFEVTHDDIIGHDHNINTLVSSESFQIAPGETKTFKGELNKGNLFNIPIEDFTSIRIYSITIH